VSEANKTQVGGSHYKSKIEHWDFVVANDLNYFEGQITKYVARARKKNGRQDLLKAKHFLEKYLEVFDQMEPSLPPVQVEVLPRTGKDIDAEWDAQDLASKQFKLDGHTGAQAFYQCVHCRKRFAAGSPLTAKKLHGSYCTLAPAPDAPKTPKDYADSPYNGGVYPATKGTE